MGTVLRDLPLVDGFSIEADAGKAGEWLSPYLDRGRVAVTTDQLIPWPSPAVPRDGGTARDLQERVAKSEQAGRLSRIRRFLGRIFFGEAPKEPSTLDATMATIGMDQVWAKGYTGKGITVAFIDSGVHPHPDFKDRIVAWKDMDDPSKLLPHDERGHGTHVAGLMVGNGKLSGGRIMGGAPDAGLVALKLKSEINGEEDEKVAISEAIAGLQWIVDHREKYNIRVVNLSLGVTPTTGWKTDPWAQAVEKTVAAGITVVTVAGNENDPLFCQCITTPGIAPSALTAGAIDDQNTADPSDDSIFYRSSRGPTIDGLPKPDVTAPGVNVTSALAPDSRLARDNPTAKDYIDLTGTSQAAPVVAGLVAVLLQANPNLTPAEIKEILMASARPIEDVSPNAQGAGTVYAPKALELALAKKQAVNAA